MQSILKILLVLSLAFTGLVLMAAIAGRYLVPDGSGLAGAPTALMYGLMGAVGGVILGVVLAAKLPRVHLNLAALLFFSTAAILMLVCFNRLKEGQNSQQESALANQGISAVTTTPVSQ